MSADDQYNLGCLYYLGIGIKVDLREADKCFKLAHVQGYIFAKDRLGFLQYCKAKKSKETEKAIMYYTRSAENGNAEAQNVMGYFCKENKFYDEAFKYFKLVSDQENLNIKREAQFNLGELYEKGLGVEQDNNKAIKYYKLSIAQRYVPALKKMGNLHEHGLLGFKKDCFEAERCYRAAIDEGSLDAMEDLGYLYTMIYSDYFMQQNDGSDNYEKVVSYLNKALEYLMSYSLKSSKPVAHISCFEEIMKIAEDKKDIDLIRLAVKAVCACYYTTNSTARRLLSYLNGDKTIVFSDHEKNWLKQECSLEKWIAKLPAEDREIFTFMGGVKDTVSKYWNDLSF